MTDEEYEDLVKELKEFVKRDRAITLPVNGNRVKLEAVTLRDQSEYINIYVTSSNKNSKKFSTIAIYMDGTPLLRIDLEPCPPHTNPDYKIIKGSHIHIFQEGYSDRWAHPLRDFCDNVNLRMEDLSDRSKIFEYFCRRLTIKENWRYQVGFNMEAVLKTKYNFVDDYVAWLKANISSYTFENGMTEITVPFLDHHNDHMQIYVQILPNNNFLLSDDSVVINDLIMSGVNLDTQKRKDILENLLSSYGVSLVGEELQVECTSLAFPQCKNMLIQAMHSVSDMFMLNSSSVATIFSQDVEAFLISQKIPFNADPHYSGKSGITHKFDFSLPRIGNSKEKLIKSANNLNLNTSKLYLFETIEVQAKKNFDLVVFYNDLANKPSKNALNALSEYGTKLIPWSKRDEFDEYLRGA